MKNRVSLLFALIGFGIIIIGVNSCENSVDPIDSIHSTSMSMAKVMDSISVQVYGIVYKTNGYTPWPGKAGDSVYVYKDSLLMKVSGINGSGQWSASGYDSVWSSGYYFATTNVLSDRFGSYKGSKSFYHSMDTTSIANIVLIHYND